MGGLRRLRALTLKARGKAYYTVAEAGARVGLGRTQSYVAADEGLIPTERHGEKLLLVPKRPWDRRVRRLLKPKK
jgi:hypothetical protein